MTCEHSDDGKHECKHCDEKWPAEHRTSNLVAVLRADVPLGGRDICRLMKEAADEIERLTADLRETTLAVRTVCAERDRLREFKEYVHQRLDEAGIPKDPPGPHRDAGCRIGQRLDLVLAGAAGGQSHTGSLPPGGDRHSDETSDVRCVHIDGIEAGYHRCKLPAGHKGPHEWHELSEWVERNPENGSEAHHD